MLKENHFSQLLKLLFLSILLTTFSCSHHKSSGKSGNKMEEAGEESGQLPLDMDLKVEKRVLDNGLTLLLVKNSHLPIFSYYTFYKVGSKYEDKGITGASHFLEHLMFKGAKKYGPGEFDRNIEGKGGSSNAYTTMDLTVYHEDLPIAGLEKIVDMEADRMENLLLEPKAFEKERQVILEERKFRYENSPQGQLYLAMFQNIFTKTPYENSVIGDIPDIQSVSRDQIFNYFKEFYAPNNAVIVVVGDFEVEKLAETLTQKFGSISRSPKIDSLDSLKGQRDQESRYAHQAPGDQVIKLNGNAPSAIFTLSYPGEPAGKKRSYVMDILASILGDGRSSYFVQEYIQGQNPHLSSLYVNNYNLQKSGIFIIGGEMLGNLDPEKFLQSFKKDRSDLCEKAITEHSVQKAKNQYFISYYDELETNAGIAEFIGLHEVYFGNYDHYKDEIKSYQAVTVKEVKEICHEIIEKGQPNFFAVWKDYPQPGINQ